MLSDLFLARVKQERVNSRSIIAACCALAALLGGIACSDDDKDDKEVEVKPIVLLPNAVAIDQYLLLVDKASDRAFILNAKPVKKSFGDDLIVTDLKPNTYYAEGRKGTQKQALVLSAGLRGVSSSPASFSLLSMTDGKMTASASIEEPFDSLLQSENGKYALLYFGKGSDELVYNRNQFAVVTLPSTSTKTSTNGASTSKLYLAASTKTQTPALQVRIINVGTPGGEPTQVALSPAMTFGDTTRIVAVILSRSYATLVDITDPKRAFTQVQLGSSGEGGVVPEQVAFNAERREIYLRGAKSNDLFVLTLIETEEENFTTRFAQLSVSNEATDLAQYGEPSTARLLAVSEVSKEAFIIDLPEDSSAEVVYSEPIKLKLSHAVNRILLFDAGNPADPSEDPEQRALLYQIGGTEVTFLDLLDAETDREQNLQTLSVDEPISKVIAVPSQKIALLLHESARIDILNLEKRELSVLDVNGAVGGGAIYSTDLPVPRLWIAPREEYLLGYVDLKTGKTGELLLDDPISQLVKMEFPKRPTDSLLVPIQEKDGKVTVTLVKLTNTEPTRETAVSFSDFPTVEAD
jgi:hypothetical protein